MTKYVLPYRLEAESFKSNVDRRLGLGNSRATEEELREEKFAFELQYAIYGIRVPGKNKKRKAVSGSVKVQDGRAKKVRRRARR